MRTPEQTEQFKKDYLAQIDVKSLNKIEKVLYTYAASRALSNTSPWGLDMALEKHSIDSLEHSQLLQAGYHLPHLLPSWLSDKLAYLLGYQETKSEMTGIYRIRLSDAGSLSESKVKAYLVIAWIIALHGASLDDLVRSRHTMRLRQFEEVDASSFIGAALRERDAEVIAATKEVLTSENNVGILSYSLVCAIERSDNEEFHDLLLNLLKAAKLQEGLRQVIVESGDSYNMDFYLKLLKVIDEEGLLRYSSVRRAVQTWCGLGYDKIEDKDIATIFHSIRRYLEHPEERATAYAGENPLEAYIALYTAGGVDAQVAYAEAEALMANGKPSQLSVAALWYLERINQQKKRYDALEYIDVFVAHSDEFAFRAYLTDELSKPELLDTFVQHKKAPKLSEKKRKALEQIHQMLLDWLPTLKADNKVVHPGFEWFSISFAREAVINALFATTIYLHTQEAINSFLAQKIPSWGVHIFTYYSQSKLDKYRDFFFSYVLPMGTPEVRRGFLLRNALTFEDDALFLVFREAFLREQFTDKEIKLLDAKFKSKVSTTRQRAVQLLLTQPDDILVGAYERLQRTKGDYIADCLMELREGSAILREKFGEMTESEKKNFEDGASDSRAAVGKGKSKAAQVGDAGDCQLRFGWFTPTELPQLPFENPFSDAERFAESPVSQWVSMNEEQKSMLSQGLSWEISKPKLNLSKLFPFTEKEVKAIYDDFAQIIEDNKELTYQNKWGETLHLNEGCSAWADATELDQFPYPELWKGWIKRHNITDEKVLGLELMVSYLRLYDRIEVLPLPLEGYPLANKGKRVQWEYAWMFEDFMQSLQQMVETRQPQLVFSHAYTLCQLCYWYAPQETYKKHNWYRDDAIYPISEGFPLTYAIRKCDFSTHCEFERVAPMLLAFYHRWGEPARQENWEDVYHLSTALLLQLHAHGIINEDQLFTQMELYDFNGLYWMMSIAYAHRRGALNLKKVEEMEKQAGSDADFICYVQSTRDLVDRYVNHLFEVEMQRRNAPTEATEAFRRCHYVLVLKGAERVARIMKALRKDHLKIDIYGTERRSILSSLATSCYPLPTDTPDMLADISEELLVELAFFAPQWLDLVEQRLNWPGFRTAYYYFIAHAREMGNDEKKALIARYTELDPQDLADGAFDEALFRQALEEIGEERFELCYKAAKYIGSGAIHTRARRYADVVQGKVTEEELMAQIQEKRNKDAVCALGLLTDRDDAAIQRRYLRIQQFLKESKQFGAQRQASEKRVCEIALLNLSRGAGFADPVQLTWRMEALQVESAANYLEGIDIEGYSCIIFLKDDGTNMLQILKDEKLLKSVPAKLKKHPQYLEIAEVSKAWKAQHYRARFLLEDMMQRRTPLAVDDVRAILSNPVVSPMFKKLVLLQDQQFGLPTAEGLATLDGLKKYGKSPLLLAHPVDFNAARLWAKWQSHLFAEKLVQPFKQVFRELYVPMPEESKQSESRRYSGYQIQVKQAAAALRSRGWTASYEDGLQKVFLAQGICVSLYAQADWFSPSDVEAPAIEYVQFSRTRYVPDASHLHISDLDPVLYSEVMRDIDMAVSIAFVGGVDPETGQSTKELRAAIVRCTAELMKFANVSISGNHVHIKGMLANYTVHLGSGLVRQEGGTVIPIIPVHSQHRGRIYLPFMDEDPKTVEIISKVVLLAEDNKLKDPTILQWIQPQVQS